VYKQFENYRDKRRKLLKNYFDDLMTGGFITAQGPLGDK
jgi:hypothetical protein